MVSPASNYQQSFLDLSMINPFAYAKIETSKTQKTIHDVHVSVGSSNIIVDGIRNLISIPSKVLLWNSSFNSGNVSTETIDKVKEYLHEQDLHDVHVSVNEYNPGPIWKRTFSNPKTSKLAKIWGIPKCLMETFLPSKLLGHGDHYDPLSNTIHIFSNDPAIALHECGHAKDFNSRENPILYRLSSKLPYVGSIITLYHEYKATSNATAYIREKKWDTILAHSFKVLIPAYATYCADAVFPDIGEKMWRMIDICNDDNNASLPDFNSTKTWTMMDFENLLFKTLRMEECESLQKVLPIYTLGFGAIMLTGHLIGRILANKVKNDKPDPKAKTSI